MTKINEYIDKLYHGEVLRAADYADMLKALDGKLDEQLLKRAVSVRRKFFKNAVYIRGLIEFTNYCKQDCFYCGLRRSNKKVERYRMTQDEILSACANGYELGVRTFVLQGGEDEYFDVLRMTDIIRKIKRRYNDCAITLSLGEKDEQTYKAYKQAGADRYLLRHETANCDHYAKLHPEGQTLKSRFECLRTLKRLGFQVGAGFMVGSPYQTLKDIAQDLVFLQEFQPHMVGIGPFIPHKDTPFGEFLAGDTNLTLNILAIVRLILKTVLLPTTTALNTLNKDGGTSGILAGANVIMPNITPAQCRAKYILYNGKTVSGDTNANEFEALKRRILDIGYQIVVDRGDALQAIHI